MTKLHFFILAFFGLCSLQSQATSSYRLYTYGEKVGITAGTVITEKNAALVDLEMARSEYEIFSVALAPPNKKTRKPVFLKNPKLVWQGAKPQVTFSTYLLGVHRLTKSSYQATLVPGEVADIPVPLEWVEKKWITLPEENVPARPTYLFELRTEPDGPAGYYKGELTFEFNKQNYKIPIRLKVHNTVLPAKFDLETSFGFAPWDVLKKHYGKWHKDNMKLYKIYAQAALEHRIDLHKFYVKYPQEEAKDPLMEGPVAEQTFLGQTEGLYNGSLSPFGFQMKITDLPIPLEYKKVKNSKVPKDKLEAFWKRMNATVLKHKLQDRSFVYFVDEPKKEDLDSLGEDLRTIRKWAPDLRFLVTNPYKNSLEGAVNLWCVGLSNLDRPTEKPSDFYLQRTLIQESSKNEKFWIYVGCNAHGCSGTEDPGTPDLIIDRASAYQRAFPWVALRYQAQGILYYDTVYGYSKGTAESPWKDPFAFTGFGEGNLFYPCTEKLGQCKEPRMLSSLRLKILRDGLEDVQILKMALPSSPLLKEQVHKLVVGVQDFKKSTEAYEKVKRSALQALSTPAKPTAKTVAK